MTLKGVSQKMWYVYLLCDPDTEIPFYVGKDTGARIDQHESFLDANWDWNEAKKRKIRQIKAQGKAVLKKIVAEFEIEQDAFIYEWALITCYHEHLTNIRSRKLIPEKVYVNPHPKPRLNLLKTMDVAEILGIKRAEVRRLAFRGEIPFRYVNSEIRFDPQNIEVYKATSVVDIISSLDTKDAETPKAVLPTEDILDAEEVGKLLRIHQRTVIRLASQGQLPGFKVGGQWRFKRQDIEDYMEEQKKRYAERKDEE